MVNVYKGRIKCGTITNLRHVDPLLFFSDCLNIFEEEIGKSLRKFISGEKVNITLCCIYS